MTCWVAEVLEVHVSRASMTCWVAEALEAPEAIIKNPQQINREFSPIFYSEIPVYFNHLYLYLIPILQ